MVSGGTKMIELTLPEVIWRRASVGLPERLRPALKRWVSLGSFSADEEARLSRATGGRI